MAPAERILITGGTGYLGSHTAVALLERGHGVVLLDDLSNSREGVADEIGSITGRRPRLIAADVRDRAVVGRILREESISAVVHFAGLKSVTDSVLDPLAYFDSNVGGSITLLGAMRDAGVRTLVFSSSAAVYGAGASAGAAEDADREPATPYGLTKVVVEDLLAAVHRADPGWRFVILRYFNPVGAHESARIGEAPVATPSNLMPILLEVGAGKRKGLEVFGGDYPTRDGTAIRDYIHVMDLADAHAAAVAWNAGRGGLLLANVGAGRGVTVLELIAAFEAATGVKIPYRIVGRRGGDAAESWANVGVAEQELGWRARRDLATMCRDAWRWERHRLAAAGVGSLP